ncbi:MAG: methyltransferase domain-containing protein [Planctomycetes bacterium]|nr:methyltransferase domain-containing protein [Planctomycetota bacterium]
MSGNRNPQQAQMADESMVRNLAAQAKALWPLEKPLFERYGAPAKILDLACGTGEITRRLAELFPTAQITGVDLEEAHLNSARNASAAYGERLKFEKGDAFDLSYPDGSFDLSLVRHMLQAVPDAHLVLAQLKRVTKPGGRLHVLAEDYSMMHFHPTSMDADEFWRLGPITFAANTGSDLRSGRKIFTWLSELGCKDVRVDYLTCDTVRVDRALFASIWEAWRDGYTDIIAQHTTLSREQVWDHWNDMIDTIRNPHGYACWQIPIISAKV